MRLLVILGSVREGRNGIKVASWFNNLASKHFDVDFADLAEIDLPMQMESKSPSSVIDFAYTSDQTKAWSDKVRAADAVVLVHPEYNHSVSAPLKNAIDHIYHEWRNKPVALVSYGSGPAADAAAHLRFLSKYVKWNIIEPSVAIPQVWAAFDETGDVKDKDHITTAQKVISTLGEMVQ